MIGSIVMGIDIALLVIVTITVGVNVVTAHPTRVILYLWVTVLGLLLLWWWLASLVVVVDKLTLDLQWRRWWWWKMCS